MFRKERKSLFYLLKRKEEYRKDCPKVHVGKLFTLKRLYIINQFSLSQSYIKYSGETQYSLSYNSQN